MIYLLIPVLTFLTSLGIRYALFLQFGTRPAAMLFVLLSLPAPLLYVALKALIKRPRRAALWSYLVVNGLLTAAYIAIYFAPAHLGGPGRAVPLFTISMLPVFLVLPVVLWIELHRAGSKPNGETD